MRQADRDFIDRGGFRADVELWHRDAEAYSRPLHKGMRILVDGRQVLDTCKDTNGNDQSAMKFQANRVAFLPHRIVSVTMSQNTGLAQSRPVANGPSRVPALMPAPTSDDFDDQLCC